MAKRPSAPGDVRKEKIERERKGESERKRERDRVPWKDEQKALVKSCRGRAL